MILEFCAANYLSIKEEIKLSFVGAGHALHPRLYDSLLIE